jgi:hypothetical protein
MEFSAARMELSGDGAALGPVSMDFLPFAAGSAQAPPGQLDFKQLPQEIREDTKSTCADAQQHINGRIQSTAEEIKQEGQKIQGTRNAGAVSDFRKRMIEKRDKLKKEIDAKIDHTFDKLIDIGERHPATQGVLGAFASVISDGIARAFNAIMSFFEMIIDTVKRWVEKAIDAISEFFTQTVPHTFKKIGEGIAHAFGF